MCLDADSEAYGCGIDMIDGALETLDLTLSKRGMNGFASDILAGDNDRFWMNDPHVTPFTWHFPQNHGRKYLPLGSKKGYFLMKFCLQSFLKKFLEVVGSHVRYLEGLNRSALYNALTLVAV